MAAAATKSHFWSQVFTSYEKGAAIIHNKDENLASWPLWWNEKFKKGKEMLTPTEWTRRAKLNFVNDLLSV